MVNEAKEHEAADQDRRELVEARNNLDNAIYQTEKTLGEHGDKQSSLGFSDELYEEGELKKNMLKMAIKSDHGYIFFNELLYRCMRRKYGNMKINKKMQVFELIT